MTDKMKTITCKIIAIGVTLPTIWLFNDLTSTLGDTMSIYYLFFLIAKIIFIYSLIALISIILINVCIVTIQVSICKINKEKILDIYVFPFYYNCESKKIKLVNIMCFISNSVNYKVNDFITIEHYTLFKNMLKKRNTIIILFTGLFIIIVTIIVSLFSFTYGCILFISMLIQIVTQSKFQTVNEPRGISICVDDTYMLQYISCLLCAQEVKLSKEILLLLENIADSIEKYQFYKEIIVSIIITPKIIVNTNFDEWLDKIIYNILSQGIYESYAYRNKFRNLISGKENHFYEHYDILLLYLARNNGYYVSKIIDYVENMLFEIKENQIHDTYLSNQILKDRFLSFENSYYDAIRGKYFFDHNFTKIKLNTIYRRKKEEQFLYKCKLLHN